jgi:O-antigen ligase
MADCRRRLQAVVSISSRRRTICVLGAVYFLLIGGSELGAVYLPVQIANLVIGGVFTVLWLRRFSIDHDVLDIAMATVAIAAAIAAISSAHQRVSIGSALAGIAWIAVVYWLRRLTADAGWRLEILRSLAMVGSVLAVAVLLWWGAIWVEWIELTGNPPPLDMRLPVGPYRGTHVLAMLIAMLMPAIWAISPTGRARLAAMVGSGPFLAVIVMSGGRGVWLAVAAASVLTVVVTTGARSLFTSRVVVGAGVVALVMFTAAATTGLGAVIVERLAETETVEARARIWRAAIEMFTQRPVTGTGLGTFAESLSSTTYFDVAPFAPRHADNAYLQLVAEGGALMATSWLILLAAGGVLAWRYGRREAAAVWALAFVAAAAVFDNPTDSPNLVLLALIWAAVLTPRRAASPQAMPPRPFFPALRGVAIWGLVGVVATYTAAAVSYEVGKARLSEGNVRGAITALEWSAGLDPGLALYRRDLGTLRILDGDTEGVTDVSRALSANPSDDTAARILAASARSDADMAAWAERAVGINPTSTSNRLLAWAVTGDVQHVAEAVLLYPWLTAAPSLEGARDEIYRASFSRSRTTALDPDIVDERMPWIRTMVGSRSGSIEAIAALLECDFTAALRSVDGISSVRVIVERASQPRTPTSARALQLRDPRIGNLAFHEFGPVAASAGGSQDRVFYNRIPMSLAPVGPMLATPEEGLSTWLRTPGAAAELAGASGRYPRCDA